MSGVQWPTWANHDSIHSSRSMGNAFYPCHWNLKKLRSLSKATWHEWKRPSEVIALCTAGLISPALPIWDTGCCRGSQPRDLRPSPAAMASKPCHIMIITCPRNLTVPVCRWRCNTLWGLLDEDLVKWCICRIDFAWKAPFIYNYSYNNKVGWPEEVGGACHTGRPWRVKEDSPEIYMCSYHFHF